jgi:hypothetical protein
MEMSNHAIKRSQQRGIPRSVRDAIIEFGTAKRKPGNVIEYRLHKKRKGQIIQQCRQLIQSLDKCNKKGVLVDLNARRTITVYNIK